VIKYVKGLLAVLAAGGFVFGVAGVAVSISNAADFWIGVALIASGVLNLAAVARLDKVTDDARPKK
jgi:hypothetical protein